MRATFTTTAGVRGHTASIRRYVVVDRQTAEILYRTDDFGRARRRAQRHGGRARTDIIDTLTGEVL